MPRQKELLIVESPTKARTISRLLANRMTVMSSKGHILDLPKTRLGVDLQNNFEPTYIRIRGKESIVRELKDAARKAKRVYIGSDPDREGEAIAYSIAQVVNGNKVLRLRLHEITPAGLKRAFAQPSAIDLNMVDSQKARRILDRLVGYLTSPLLWQAFAQHTLSAGRVQTVALRLICEREKEILGFQSVAFWIIDCTLKTPAGDRFTARLVCRENERGAFEDCRINSPDEAEIIKREIETAQDIVVTSVQELPRERKPNPPFITSTLQQEAARVFRFSGQRTMQVAQQLFEGVSLGKEAVGLITYPRTDAVRVSEDMIQAARAEIQRRFGPEYLPPQPLRHKDRQETQGAHEAIRPTALDRTPEAVKEYLSPEQYKLYDLIYRRFLASQMSSARYQSTTVLLTVQLRQSSAAPNFKGTSTFTLQTTALRRLFPGFEVIYGTPDKEKSLPALNPGEHLTLVSVEPEQHFTQPPARYSEASLIKKLEVNGIGRPSTYATIVATLVDRNYVRRKSGRLFPTELGMKVNDLLIPRFDNIFEVGFTRQMEKSLDMIEMGKEKWQEVVRRFYEPFLEDLSRAEKELTVQCPKCGKPLVLKRSRYGSFLACSGYPECDYVRRKESEAKLMEQQCPKCGKPLVQRESRFGKFVGCSGYPECTYIHKPDHSSEPEAETPKLESEPATCPECGRPLTEKSGRFGRFLGCSGYPECRYIYRPEPKLEPGAVCPICAKPLTVRTGRYGKFIGCTGYPECRYIESDSPRPVPRTLEETCPQCGRALVERSGRFGSFVSCSGYPECKYRPPKTKK